MRTEYPLIAVAVIAVLGCSPAVDEAPASAPCPVGQVINCTCEGGAAGEKTCGDDKKFGDCVCPDAGPTDAGGKKKPDAITAGDAGTTKVEDAGTTDAGPTAKDTAVADIAADAGSDPVDTAPPVELAAHVTTVAGNGNAASTDGVGAAASFNRPLGLAVHKGVVYVSDHQTNRIRKIAADGTVSTLAGSGYGHADGKGSAAKFRKPAGMTADSLGNIYVADRDSHRIRKITPDGTVTTIAGVGSKGSGDGDALKAGFQGPEDIAATPAAVFYVADTLNSRVRRIENGKVKTVGSPASGFADGTFNSAKFTLPAAIAGGPKGDLFVADTLNNAVRHLQVGPKKIVTLAGKGVPGSADGKGKAATFKLPRGIAVGADGTVYVADTGNHRLRRVLADGTVTTIAGSSAGFKDATANGALFNEPRGLAVDRDAKYATVYVADTKNHRVRKYFLAPK